MASNEEHHQEHHLDSDGEHTHYSQHHQQALLQNLFFPRSRSQIFLPLNSSHGRRNSFRPSASRQENALRRSQALLQREQTPALAWEKYRKSDNELKCIKNKRVREFYEDQVFFLLNVSDSS